jgi:hypothetical protein
MLTRIRIFKHTHHKTHTKMSTNTILYIPLLIRFVGNQTSDYRTYVTNNVNLERIIDDEERVKQLKQDTFTTPIYKNYWNIQHGGISVYTTASVFQEYNLKEMHGMQNLRENEQMYTSIPLRLAGEESIVREMCTKLTQRWTFALPDSDRVLLIAPPDVT